MNYFFDPIMKHYFDFKGVATRKAYWLFALFLMLLNIVMTVLDIGLGTFNEEAGIGVISAIFGLLMLFPSLSIAVRRLHDAGFSGWWMLLMIVPFGFIVLLIFMLLPSKVEGNKYRQAVLEDRRDEDEGI